MEINLKVHEDRTESRLNKIAMFLLGIFVTATLFAVTIDALDAWGVYFSFFISAAAVFFGFRYFQKGSIFRYSLYGIISTIVLVAIVLFAGLSYISGTLEKIF